MLLVDVRNVHGKRKLWQYKKSHSDLLTYQYNKGTNQGISSAMASITKVNIRKRGLVSRPYPEASFSRVLFFVVLIDL